MEYQYIRTPNTGRKINVNSRLGRQIVTNYVNMSGGLSIIATLYR